MIRQEKTPTANGWGFVIGGAGGFSQSARKPHEYWILKTIGAQDTPAAPLGHPTPPIRAQHWAAKQRNGCIHFVVPYKKVYALQGLVFSDLARTLRARVLLAQQDGPLRLQLVETERNHCVPKEVESRMDQTLHYARSVEPRIER